MARDFRQLEAKMDPKRLARSRTKATREVQSMLLAEIRRHSGRTQSQLAKDLGIKQPSLSKLENQPDMQISTLRRIIQALGGELEITARLPRQTIHLSQFARPM